MSNINVRSVSIESIDRIITLDRLCFGGLWSENSYQRELTNDNSHFLAVTVDSNPDETMESIIGFGCFWAILDEAHITLLGIHPDYQGQGLGQLLLRSMLDRARSIEMARATLEVRPSNQGAIHIYEKHGFQTVGRRKKYYQDNGEDGIIMWRGGLQHPYFPNDKIRQPEQASSLGIQGRGNS
jgi:[ribosomal protein S18]-alanine N-acetyltransferase